LKVAALNQSLVRTVVTTDDDVAEMDTFPTMEGDDATKMQVTD
jgi:LPS O-antigen subunit length determinant protein (WzzB/FepE family)